TCALPIYVRVTAEWIVGAGANALAIVIPIVVITVVMLVPALVLAVVVAVAVIIVVAVLVPALVFAVVVVLGAGRDSRREGKYGRSKSQKWQELFHDLLSKKIASSRMGVFPVPTLRVGVGWGWYYN